MTKSPISLYTLLALLSSPAFASTPLFSVTPRVTPPSSLYQQEQGTGIYQITNNTPNTLSNMITYGLAAGVTPVPSAGYQYCPEPFTLAPNSSCLMKYNINAAQTTGTVSGGPKIAWPSTTPLWISQPFFSEQFNITMIPQAQPTSCSANTANFDYELSQELDSTPVDPSWGPPRACLPLNSTTPDLASCYHTAGVSWQQERILAAANFWINQKLNYCHHYNPDFYTPISERNGPANQGGYCSTALDYVPGSPYYLQQARWNYSGKDSETIENWQNNNYMWYGMDCSNYTSFIYNFAFGIKIDSETAYQAGQIPDSQLPVGYPSQLNFVPNGQVSGISHSLLNNNNNPPNMAAGTLLCADGSLADPVNLCNAVTPMPGTDGTFLSSLKCTNNTTCVPTFTKNITIDTLTSLPNPLQPGDLLYIAGAAVAYREPTNSIVTHVVMWTGKQVGYGPNDIDPSLIAPDDICLENNQWMPQIGDWVITDSHYQGADYRVLTQCFYLNNLWGVRRVLGLPTPVVPYCP